jgi:hypothetical protein
VSENHYFTPLCGGCNLTFIFYLLKLHPNIFKGYSSGKRTAFQVIVKITFVAQIILPPFDNKNLLPEL